MISNCSQDGFQIYRQILLYVPAHPTFVTSFLMTSGNTLTCLRATILIFHLNQRHQQERETYTTSRDHWTMALTSVFTPPSSTRLTHCDLDLAHWLGKDSIRRVMRQNCYMILNYSSELIVYPRPQPKYRDNPGCESVLLEPWKTCNIQQGCAERSL